MDINDKIIDHLKKIQNPKRFQHSLGTEQTAVNLGNLFHLDSARIRTAALLHDIGKSMNLEEQIAFADKNRIHLAKEDLQAKGVIHAILGSFIAEQEFDIKDPEVLNAIRYHTTGHAGMTLFQKIIFASDYIDPSRGARNERNLEKLVMEDLEKGVLEIIKDKLTFVVRKGEYLHPLSVEFYNSQLELVRSRGDK